MAYNMFLDPDNQSVYKSLFRLCERTINCSQFFFFITIGIVIFLIMLFVVDGKLFAFNGFRVRADSELDTREAIRYTIV